MRGSLRVKCVACLAAFLMVFCENVSRARAQISPFREMIHVYSEVYSVSEHGPVYLYVWFKGFPSSLAALAVHFSVSSRLLNQCDHSHSALCLIPAPDHSI